MTVTAEEAATQTPAEQALFSAAQIAIHVNRLDEISPELDDVTRVRVAHALATPSRDLGIVLRGYLNRVAQQMEADGRKMAIVDMPDGSQVTVEKSVKATRKDIRRDDLVAAVEREANEPKNRVNTETGEMAEVPDTKVRLFKKCFRMEPRWTELKALGIDDDEYCHREWEPTARIQEGGRL